MGEKRRVIIDEDIKKKIKKKKKKNCLSSIVVNFSEIQAIVTFDSKVSFFS